MIRAKAKMMWYEGCDMWFSMLVGVYHIINRLRRISKTVQCAETFMDNAMQPCFIAGFNSVSHVVRRFPGLCVKMYCLDCLKLVV